MSSLAPSHSLNPNSIGLVQGVFQALTHMGPASGVASSLLVAVSFAQGAAPLAVILAMVVALLVGVAVGSLAREFTSAGGLAYYVERVLGTRAGAFVGWLYAPLELLIAPVVYMFFGQFMSGTIASMTGVTIPWWLFAVAAAVLVCFLNVRGVEQSTTAGVVVGLAEITIFLALSVWMIVAGGSHNTVAVLDPSHAVDGWSGIFKAVVFSILAFQGFETAAPLAEETRDPKRTIPRTILYSALGCGIFYVLCTYGGIVGWGFDKMGNFASAASPWIDLAQRFWGPVWLLILFALINSFIGNANAGSIAASRILFSLGRAGRLPTVFATTHPERSTPTFAVYFQAGLAIAVSLGLGLIFGPVEGFTLLGALLTVFAVIIYIMTCLACIRFFTAKPKERGLNVLLHVVLPALAIAILLVPLWYQFVPWPDYPGNVGDAAAIVIVLLALIAAFFARPLSKETLEAEATPR